MNPKTVRIATLGVVAIAAVAAVGIWKSRAVIADLPPDVAQVSPSAEFANAEASADYYRAAIRKDPEAVEPRVRLAQVLMQLASQTGNERLYVPEAQRVLGEALERDPNNYYGLTLQARLFNTLHRFEDARDISKRLLDLHPQYAYAHGTLVDALVELGQYDEAVQVSDQMQAIRPGLPAYSRASYLRELHGDIPGAVAAMRMAADAEPEGRTGRAWALVQLGNLYLRQAKADTAAFIYRGILEENPTFGPAMTELGHVALVEGNIPEAIQHFEEARATGPSVTNEALLAQAYSAAGDARKAAEAGQRELDIYRTFRETGGVVDMEEADYLADHDLDLKRALELATIQIRRRPGHLHANSTYAWALFKNGRAGEAIPFIQRAMRLGTSDAVVHYRAGRIYEAAGHATEAAGQYRAAIATNLRMENLNADADARARLAAMGRTASGAPAATRTPA